MEKKEEVRNLLSDIAKKEHIISKLGFLSAREKELIGEVAYLRTEMEMEEAEAVEMEKTGVLTVFLTIIGQRSERLEKERKEAIIATEKYKLAKSELDAITLDIEKCRRDLRYIERCEKKYAELIKEVATEVGENNESSEIRALREQLFVIESRIKETDEAIAEGERVYRAAMAVVELLSQYIKAWHPQHHYGGLKRTRSEKTKILAHEKLKQADNMLKDLPETVTRFRAELADVDLDFDGEVYPYALVSATNYYADMFAGAFTNDGSEYIARDSTKKLGNDAIQIVSRLEKRRSRLESDREVIKKKIENVIL